tara:strand:+ start:3083 stop:4198 length:1116 start_codon:yes stop_codon:yes gene_type:complete
MNLNNNLKFKKNKNRLFIFIITFPILLSSIYFYAIGRKRYFVRSDIIVRTASVNGGNAFDITNIIGAGNSSSIEDALFLQTYLESPQVLKDLENVFEIKKTYEKKGLDLYAGLSKDASLEEKYHFFRKQISIGLNERSGILRIRSLALDPETAYKFNRFLINQSEKFVNKLNQSIYKEQIDFLNQQVEKNAKRLEIANKDLSEFQKSNKILDAISEATLNTELISELESQLVRLKVELASIKRQYIDKSSPEIVFLEDQILELRNQISKERNNLVSPEGKNYNEIIITIEKLKANQNFSRDLYLGSLKAAEKASVDSVQQQRFLAIISEPQLPEDEWRYWRHRGFLTLVSIFFVSISLLKFILGMADSHNN